jgi:hypothetical protein
LRHADRFTADYRAITANKRKREAETNAPKPATPQVNQPQPDAPNAVRNRPAASRASALEDR